MAVKFEFTLNDIDAENLFQWLNMYKCGYFQHIMDEVLGENRPEYIKQYEQHMEYQDQVAERMLASQTRLEDSDEYEINVPESRYKSKARTETTEETESKEE